MSIRLGTIVLVASAVAAASAAIRPAVADPVVVGEEHCVVEVAADDTLNLRAGPGTRFVIRGTLRPDQCGIIVTAPCENGWCAAEDGHRAGFVRGTYIAPVSPALYCVTGVAADDALNLRSGPSAQAPVLTTLAPNQCDIAFLPYADAGWQRIRVSGWEGWVARRFLSGQ